MAYDDIFQPGIYKAWNEAIIKEKKIRMKWRAEYESKNKQLSLEEDVQDETPSLPCTCKRKVPDSTLESKMDWPRKGATGTNTLIRVVETSPSMVPPTPVIRSILYEGISRDGKGKAGYLKKRMQNDPSERFRHRICTNWTYGWNYSKDNELNCKDPDNCDVKSIAFGV